MTLDLYISTLVVPNMSKFSEIKVSYRTHHDQGTKTHEVENFRHYLRTDPDVLLQWGYCRECKKLRYKQLVGFTVNEDHQHIAVVRDLVYKGDYLE